MNRIMSSGRRSGIEPPGSSAMARLTADEWDRPYSRHRAAFPLPWVRANKFWPFVGRLNAVLGDRQLICSCPPIEDYAA